ncbi:hypothetical protein DKX38_029638 [Salix brachista]|uniref:TOD1/MUCI70 glycosyltransferase-like domain-containing protein n=1 Tax=Salix brachista TaxID=2182728 RepID=A0A5N5J335_9ROSI|nr:hypothetical protein DKX38_029638 [Salix brachista]
MAQYRHYANGTSDHVSIGIRASSSSSHQQKSGRVRRLGYRSDKSSRGGCSLIGAVIVFLCLVLVVTVLAYYFLSTEITINGKDVNDNHVEDDMMKNDDFLTNVTRTDTIKVLGFGQGSVGHGRDSRDGESSEKGHNLVRVKNYKEKVKAKRIEDRKGVGLYNEDGRKELKMYEKEYEASLKSTGKLGNKSDINFLLLDDEDTREQNGAVDSENDYNDGIDFHDPRMEEYGADSEHDKEENSSETTVHVKDNSESSNFLDAKTKDQNIAKDNQEDSMSLLEKGSLKSQNSGDGNTDSRRANNIGGHSTSKSRPDSKKKSKRHKSGCGMKFLNSTTRLVEPFESRKFARFSLQYTEIEEKPEGQEQWEPRFAGHQSLHEREDSFLAQDQKIKCGFVKGPEGSSSTGFDLAEDDESYISRCHIAVISCIFGNSDRLRSPVNKMVGVGFQFVSSLCGLSGFCYMFVLNGANLIHCAEIRILKVVKLIDLIHSILLWAKASANCHDALKEYPNVELKTEFGNSGIFNLALDEPLRSHIPFYALFPLLRHAHKVKSSWVNLSISWTQLHHKLVMCVVESYSDHKFPSLFQVTRLSRKNVCFVMFMDEVTLQTLSSEGHIPDTAGFIGLWKIVVVKNLPYDDMRRVGKVPKLLPHRLFPSARYSIWLDSKLRLQVDPLLVLEYFLWRKGFEFAISKHYDRHCVWEEVDQNKRLNKYNHTAIDQQFASYKSDGLKRFNVSDPNKLLPSNVPEGSFIVRAHTPMSNLFSCLWFNEVDRFTPRDQLSFAFTYQKLRRMNPGKPFYLHMFKDCERRAIAKLFRHKSEDKRTTPRQEATE